MGTNIDVIDTKQVLEKLSEFLNQVWTVESKDILKLRSITRPPMGNLPCVLYANFNTFWMGESLQVYRLLAIEESVILVELNKTIAAVLTRHAARLSKWELHETVELVEYLASYFNGLGAKSYAEFIAVSESILVSVNRMNSWIDSLIPWSMMDTLAAEGR